MIKQITNYAKVVYDKDEIFPAKKGVSYLIIDMTLDSGGAHIYWLEFYLN